LIESSTICVVSFTDSALLPARFLTSSATTANPLPYFPALAASTFALREIGEECYYGGQCESGYCADVCTNGAVEDNCYLADDCSTGYCADVCTNGEIGDKCYLDKDCKINNCENLKCSSKFPPPPPPPPPIPPIPIWIPISLIGAGLYGLYSISQEKKKNRPTVKLLKWISHLFIIAGVVIYLLLYIIK